MRSLTGNSPIASATATRRPMTGRLHANDGHDAENGPSTWTKLIGAGFANPMPTIYGQWGSTVETLLAHQSTQTLSATPLLGGSNN